MRFPSVWLRQVAPFLTSALMLSARPSLAADQAEPAKAASAVEPSAPVRVAMPAAVDEEPEFRFEFGLFGGVHWFDSDHALGRGTGDPKGWSPKSTGMFGARLGLHFNRWVGIEGEFGGIPTKTRDGSIPGATDMWVFPYRGSLVINLSPSWRFQPFVLAGYGGMFGLLKNESDNHKNDNMGFMHAGLGFKIGFTPWTGLRVDGRVAAPWTALDPVIPAGDRLAYNGPDYEVTGGLYINFGEIEKVHIYSHSEVVTKEVSRKDSDGDGIPDDMDRCPKDPEDRDAFEDQDGCPELDNDKDGIPDTSDKCPADAEDKDGYQDDDGCPDADNDGDGIPDTADKCPTKAETVNGYQDDDGCPDEVPVAVKKFTGIIEGINFKTNSAEILPGSFALLDRAVKVLQDYPDVNLEISGHTDSRGKPDYNRDLSHRRAESVRTYFVNRGIAPERLQAIGYGMDRPIADNISAGGRSRNRRTEFRLINPTGPTPGSMPAIPAGAISPP